MLFLQSLSIKATIIWFSNFSYLRITGPIFMPVYSSYTDLELANLLKAGDHTAYTEIYNRYIWVLYGHAFAKLQNREEAKDVVQELFVTLWAKRGFVPFHTNLAGYLYTALRNRILNIIAHKQVESEYIGSLQCFLDNSEAETDYLLRQNQLAALIEKEIAALPAKMKEVFELSRKANLSHKEIAEQLHLSEKTVKNQINNALKILRVKLSLFIYLLLILNI